MFAGAPLNDNVRTALYLAARKLIQNGRNFIKFQNEDGEGGVSTKHRRKVVASGMVGIEFSAVVEYGNKTTKCRFIVNDIKMPSEDELLNEGYRWFNFDVTPERTSPDQDNADWWKN